MTVYSRLSVVLVLSAFIMGSAFHGAASAEAARADAPSAMESTAIFAGGCFWCIEKDFEHVNGVIDVVSGYTGGTNDQPTYRNHTRYKHREAVRITFDPQQVSYAELVEIFWRTVDPTDAGGQFCDRGHSYSTAIYGLDENQIDIANSSKMAIEKAELLSAPIATEIAPAETFFPAEDYHQNYYKKNPIRYKLYRAACGRDKVVKQLWGDEAYTGVQSKTGS